MSGHWPGLVESEIGGEVFICSWLPEFKGKRKTIVKLSRCLEERIK